MGEFRRSSEIGESSANRLDSRTQIPRPHTRENRQTKTETNQETKKKDRHKTCLFVFTEKNKFAFLRQESTWQRQISGDSEGLDERSGG